MDEKYLKYNLNSAGDSLWLVATPCANAKYLNLYVQELGHFHHCKNDFTEREGLKSFQIGYFLKGTGYLDYRNKVFEINEGDALWIDCEEAYRSYFKNDGAETIWVHFNSDFVKGYFSNFYNQNGGPVIRLSRSSIVPMLIRQLIDLYETEKSIAPDIRAAELLYSLMIELLDTQALRLEAGSTSQHVASALKYIHNNYSIDISLDDLSEYVRINKYHLSRLFKKGMGVSVNEYILQYRVNKSKMILRQFDVLVCEAAQMTGFDSSSHFINVFKRYEGMTPNEYKKKWR